MKSHDFTLSPGIPRALNPKKLSLIKSQAQFPKSQPSSHIKVCSRGGTPPLVSSAEGAAASRQQEAFEHMSYDVRVKGLGHTLHGLYYSLLKGGYTGNYIGTTIGVSKGIPGV